MSVGAVGGEVARELGMEPEANALVLPHTGTMHWSSALPVDTLATDSVAIASLAINLLLAERRRGTVAPVRVDRAVVAASFGSERVLRIDGAAPTAWAPLSGFWRADDAWVRTHANYPHHAQALVGLLGLGVDAGAEEVAAAVRRWAAVELEDHAARSGAVVAAVRTVADWRQHPHGRTVGDAPLVVRRFVGDAVPRRWGHGAAPLSGIRVLDLTRVIAGPVAARDLALAGAEVLRVDAPARKEMGWIHLDTGQGKRSTLLDLRDAADAAAFDRLLSRADVVITGYRPGALDRFGLSAESLADRHPGLVTASVSAWGTDGWWAERRGFDSIVQAASGIAMIESADGSIPGALPVQALDHSTGHFLAAAIVWALIEQRRSGGSIDVHMSLARTASALLDSPDPATQPGGDGQVPSRMRRLTGEGGPSTLVYAPPPLAFAGAPADYAEAGRMWGVDPAEWMR